MQFIIFLLLTFIANKALSQTCATNLDCNSFVYPRCEITTGYCDKPDSDEDCAHLEAYFVRVNTTLSYCTLCRNDTDCASGYQCREITPTIQKCFKACTSDAQCTTSPLVKCVSETSSNPLRRQCVECSADGAPCATCVYNGFCNVTATCAAFGGKAPQILASNALFTCSNTIWDGKLPLIAFNLCRVGYYSLRTDC